MFSFICLASAAHLVDASAVELVDADLRAVFSTASDNAAAFGSLTHVSPTSVMVLVAPAATKEYVDKDWNNNINPKGGAAMEAMLPFVDLVDCQYLITLGEAGGIVPRWQEVPECARINEKNVWRLRAWNEGFSCPVLCLSCARRARVRSGASARLHASRGGHGR